MGYSNDQKFTNTLPPVSIYDVLHKFECLGGDLPDEVDLWWSIETEKNERRWGHPNPWGDRRVK